MFSLLLKELSFTVYSVRKELIEWLGKWYIHVPYESINDFLRPVILYNSPFQCGTSVIYVCVQLYIHLFH